MRRIWKVIIVLSCVFVFSFLQIPTTMNGDNYNKIE